ncbi:MAG: NAD-dependent epimerase/dehydratase family protein [Candidatus Bathyarchaeia archaeon]
MNKIGIVGGAGFIGSALARHLSKSFVIKILDMKPVPKDLQKKLEYQQLDVNKYKEVERGLIDVEFVIHTAIVQIPLINKAKRLGYEVNILGTQNVCEVVNQNPSIRGLILASSWHVVGERELRGVIDEEFGFRPDRVEDRARLYVLCKIGQETIVRVYDEMSEKIYGVIRMGTVLGKGMPEMTAAAIFITNGLNGKPLTPYKHSMYRPMLYTDVNDVCKAFEAYVTKVLSGEMCKEGGSLSHMVNIYWPEPITILELAEMIRDAIIERSKGKIKPGIEIVDRGQPVLFTPEDKDLIKVDVSKVKSFLGLERMANPKETIEKLVKEKLQPRKSTIFK